jgi:hypothetical protein
MSRNIVKAGEHAGARHAAREVIGLKPCDGVPSRPSADHAT